MTLTRRYNSTSGCRGRTVSWQLIFLFLFFSSSCLAVSPSSVNAGNSNYLIIENKQDGEYFITPDTFYPRFTGANVWTKFPTKQISLGFLGYQRAWVDSYFDIWIENSPINTPFRGLRCVTTGKNCPASGFIPADVIDGNGFYHTPGGNTENNGDFAYGSLTDAAYQYFSSRPVGVSDAIELNVCASKTNYDYNSGIRCKDLTSGATWLAINITLTKVGHITLSQTNSLLEIWVASDGTPGTAFNSDNCYIAVVSNDRGITCRMVSYNYERFENITNLLTFGMVVDTAALGFTPKISSIKYSSDGTTWYNHNATTAYRNVFKQSGSGYIYVFLSKDFLKQLVQKGIVITNNDSIFTFKFYNAVTPYSGFYQFTPSSSLNILPKEYGISIASVTGGAHPSASGIIGSKQPIKFDYIVTTSASRQANSITAQVIGEATVLNEAPYCIFSSSDNLYQVPVPAYLSWTSKSGATVSMRNSCAEQPVDMTQAHWLPTAWNAAADDGYYFTTNLRLSFPMNDPLSRTTLEGNQWAGTVSASGELKVTATWIGVDR